MPAMTYFPAKAVSSAWRSLTGVNLLPGITIRGTLWDGYYTLTEDVGTVAVSD